MGGEAVTMMLPELDESLRLGFKLVFSACSLGQT